MKGTPNKQECPLCQKYGTEVYMCCHQPHDGVEEILQDWEKEWEKLFMPKDALDYSNPAVAEILIEPLKEYAEKAKEFCRKVATASRDEMNDCVCKEKWTFGVVHRKDKPCYWPTREGVEYTRAIDDCIACVPPEEREAMFTGSGKSKSDCVESGYQFARKRMLEALQKLSETQHEK